MSSPSKVARLLLAVVVCSTIFADYWEYSKAYHGNPAIWTDVLQGTAAAPQQYRIGIPKLAELLQQSTHFGLRHGFTLVDFLSALLAAYLLYALFERSTTYRGAAEVARWFGAAGFLFLLQFYLAWITWYQRPETLASTAILALTLWLVMVPLPLGGPVSRAASVLGMLTLASVQGFVRPDLIFAVHLGVFIMCLNPGTEGFALPRMLQAGTSLLAILIAGAIQWCLMHVVYPQATYRDTPVLELHQNVTNVAGILPFVLFMVPWAWLVTQLAGKRVRAEAASMALVIGSGLYVLMWVVVGRIEEVRIFLPYAVALIPLTCSCAMQRYAAVEKPVAAI